MAIASVGIDLGKTSFHLVALDDHGKVVARSKFSRKQLLAYTANLPSSLIGIEACSGAHFIGAALREQGHDVRLIPAQFVKPFLKSIRTTSLMPRRLPKRWGGRTCALFRSRPYSPSSSIWQVVYSVFSRPILCSADLMGTSTWQRWQRRDTRFRSTVPPERCAPICWRRRRSPCSAARVTTAHVPTHPADCPPGCP